MLNNRRNDGIDTLRGLSILLVILHHCYIHMPLVNNLLTPKLINIIFFGGYYGVIIFFVISGFLITSLSLKRWKNLQSISYRQFYRMRFSRIMPCLFVLLIILSGLHLMNATGFIIQTTSLSQALFSALTFNINWLEAKTGYLPANWDVLWSLSIEEIFYLFFPLACLLFRKPYYFVLAMFAFILLGPFARTVFTNNTMWSDYSYLSCMDGIAVGCLAALISNYFKLNKNIFFLILLLGISFFSFIFIFRKQTFDLGLTKIGLNVTILEISIGMILIAMQEWYIKGKRSGNVWCTPIRWFGRNSYEIYLIHSFFVIIIAETLFNPKQSSSLIVIWYTLALILSGIFGQLVSSYFSEPMNRLVRGNMQTKEYQKESHQQSMLLQGDNKY